MGQSHELPSTSTPVTAGPDTAPVAEGDPWGNAFVQEQLAASRPRGN